MAEYLPHSKEGILLSRKKADTSAQKTKIWPEKINSLPQPVRISIAVIWILLFGALLFFDRKQRHAEEHSAKGNVILVRMPPILFWVLSAFLWFSGIFGTFGMLGFLTQAFQTGADTVYAGLIGVCTAPCFFTPLLPEKEDTDQRGRHTDRNIVSKSRLSQR